MSKQRGTLYLVATPIGNLGDLSRRAVETLAAVSLVACEDTRRTRVLLEHAGVQTPLRSLPAFDERRRAQGLIEKLLAGEDVALVTDAGMPGISDPGSEVVRLAVEAGLRVVPIPGPSAPIAALAASGLPTDRFTFVGFLPRKGGAREAALQALHGAIGTLVLLESPRRLGETLADLRDHLGDRRACVARELTKVHEEFVRGTLSELEEHFSGEVLGEITVVVEGGSGAGAGEDLDLDGLLRARLDAGLSTKDAARELAEAYGLPRKELYRRALQLASEKE